MPGQEEEAAQYRQYLARSWLMGDTAMVASAERDRYEPALILLSGDVEQCQGTAVNPLAPVACTDQPISPRLRQCFIVKA